MKRVLFVFILMMGLVSKTYSSDVSLLDQENPSVQKAVNILQEVSVEESEDEDGDDALAEAQEGSGETIEDFQFQEMNDFIHQENEKIKGIKLLNLDLQRVDLELKKKEIELKIDQLSKGSMSNIKIEEGSSQPRISLPVLKLVSIFVSDNSKRAVISFNGVNRSVNEGDEIQSLSIQNINRQRVIVKDVNGQIQELYFL